MNSRGGCVLAAMALVLLGPTTPAAASPVSPDGFFPSLKQAIDESGLFDRGTTLTIRSLSFSESLATPEPIVRVQVVNPDGSLTYRLSTLDSVRDVRCAALDECWRRVTAKGSDHSWHALPAGALYYASTQPGLFDGLSENDPADPRWDISEGPKGSRVFTLTYAAGSSSGVMRWTVARRHLTMTWEGVDASGGRDVLASTIYTAAPKHAVISRPSPAAIGTRVPSESPDIAIEVLINR